MRIDLDRIPRDEPCAVHIPTIEHGQAFLDEMRIRYPVAVCTWDKPYFVEYRARAGGNYYYPRLHKEHPHMTHGDQRTYIDMGVKLLQFEDVLVQEIELITNIGDVPIESLFN